jgi:serine/threonine protein kinase
VNTFPQRPLLDSRFQLVELIGQGGMATVWKAYQKDLERHVAIKVMLATLEANESGQIRFQREAKLLSSLQHPGIVTLFQYGLSGAKNPYLVMEWIEGKSLAETYAEHSLPWQHAVNIGIQVAEALAYAHQNNIVHRDLSTRNIMLIPTGEEFAQAKVIDFGLAKGLEGGAQTLQKLTETGCMVGSLHYASPEVCAGQPATSRSDVYSLGCVLYELISGRPPFDSNDAVEIMRQHIAAAPSGLITDHGIDCPSSLERIVFWSMGKDPHQRLPSMEDFCRLLNQVRDNKVEPLPLNITLNASTAQAQTPRKVRPVALISLLLIFAIASAAFWVLFKPYPLSTKQLEQMTFAEVFGSAEKSLQSKQDLASTSALITNWLSVSPNSKQITKSELGHLRMLQAQIAEGLDDRREAMRLYHLVFNGCRRRPRTAGNYFFLQLRHQPADQGDLGLAISACQNMARLSQQKNDTHSAAMFAYRGLILINGFKYNIDWRNGEAQRIKRIGTTPEDFKRATKDLTKEYANIECEFLANVAKYGIPKQQTFWDDQ